MDGNITEDRIVQLVKEHTDRFSFRDLLEVKEIGDGNVNYVYRVENQQGNSVIVKYADEYIRGSKERKLSTKRNEIEYHILNIQKDLTGGSVPDIYAYLPEEHIIIMEDLKEYVLLRNGVEELEVYPKFSKQMASFLYHTLFLTTDLVLDPGVKKEYVRNFINVEMCEISERLVFREPYKNIQGQNSYQPVNQEFMQQTLSNDLLLHQEVGVLKDRFKNYSQSLLHGDLHSGSIFISKESTKVFDPEFSFYGPMGYDIGNVIASLMITMTATDLQNLGEPSKAFLQWLEAGIEEVIEEFIGLYQKQYREHVTEPMAQTEEFADFYLSAILSDTAGYAGTEIIRRVVGEAKTSDIERVTDPETRAVLERTLVTMGKELILHRTQYSSGKKFQHTVLQGIAGAYKEAER